MAQQLSEYFGSALDRTRYEPTPKRVRALLGEEVVLDSRAAVLVWEPRRVVPLYAVPESDVRGELRASTTPAPEVPSRPVLPPFVPFAVHTADGEPLDVVLPGGTTLAGAAFRLREEGVAGLIVLDFDAFDRWLEEDEEQIGHPRDPYHRVDVRRSSRHVRVELDGEVLAESDRPVLVAETNLPPRYYLPKEDVRTDLLTATDTTSICPYKGQAAYWSLTLGDRQEKDLVWSYPQPLEDAVALGGYLAFYDERVDIVLDDEGRERPQTEWSPGARD